MNLATVLSLSSTKLTKSTSERLFPCSTARSGSLGLVSLAWLRLVNGEFSQLGNDGGKFEGQDLIKASSGPMRTAALEELLAFTRRSSTWMASRVDMM